MPVVSSGQTLVSNGDFNTGDFTGWTLFTTANGSLGPAGSGLPVVTSFNVTGSGAQNAATFQVGEVSFDQTQQGGAIEQTVTLPGGSINFSADIAALGDTSVNSTNEEGGVFSVLLDGTTEATVDIGSIAADAVIRDTLSFTASESAGPHMLEILITRPAQNGTAGQTPEEFVTNIAITPAGTVYSGSYLSGIVLSNPTTQNPTTVAATGYVTNTTTAHNGDAVYGTNAAAWNFTNLGTIKGTGTTADGVRLIDGGIVTNGQSDPAGGVIQGTVNGVEIDGTAGTVVNFGMIEALGSITNASGSITGGNAIQLNAGGSVQNGASGSTAGLIAGYHIGILVPSAASAGAVVTVTNFGTIESLQTAINGFNGVGVQLDQGGSVANFGLISGQLGVLMPTSPGAAGTVSNLGTVEATGSLTTSGTITLYPDGVVLDGGGTVTNGQSGATSVLITGGWNGVSLEDAPGTVVNFATIESTATIISPAGFHGSGVLLGDGGSIINGSSGSTDALIQSYEIGVYIGGIRGVPTAGAVGTVVNFGTIDETGAGNAGISAVLLGSGGTITNHGLISGARNGNPTSGYPGVVEFRNTAGTVVNLGAITNPDNSNGINLLSGVG
jgi:hypothetical protein